MLLLPVDNRCMSDASSLPQSAPSKLEHLDQLNAAQLRRLLVEQLTRQKLGLYWESDSLDRDRALNENVVLPRVVRFDSPSD